VPENPELYGMGAIVVALITAWTKMRPAMKKIESEEDNSLRTDLLKRIDSLEIAERSERQRHADEIKAIRQECDAALLKMQLRHERVCTDYEAKIKGFEEKVDLLMDALLETRHIVKEGKV